MLFVYSSRPSRSARLLARRLHGRRINSFVYIQQSGDVVINWGDSSCPYKTNHPHGRVLNPPEAVTKATNKKEAFLALQSGGVSIPRFATNKEDVTWHGSSPTVVRHKLTGHSGEGIEVIEPEGELPDARLYVEYKKKQDEFRVHVIGDKVVLVQRKARRRDVPDGEVNWQVRNHSNGFIFQRNEVKVNDAVTRAAVDAIRTLGLDFGAVDIIQQKNGKVFVLEVNTAPGMEGSTINDYAEGFRNFL